MYKLRRFGVRVPSTMYAHKYSVACALRHGPVVVSGDVGHRNVLIKRVGWSSITGLRFGHETFNVRLSACKASSRTRCVVQASDGLQASDALPAKTSMDEQAEAARKYRRAVVRAAALFQKFRTISRCQIVEPNVFLRR